MKSSNKIFSEMAEFVNFADEETPRTLFKSRLLGLNIALGSNSQYAIPGGTLAQFIGKEKSGKTTLALDILAQAQQSNTIKEITLKKGKEERLINAAYIDFERSFDRKHAEMLGVDTSKLLIVKTHFAESSFTYVEHLLSEGLQFVIFDSIAMIVPESEEEKTLGDNEKLGDASKLLTRALKRLVPLTDYADALVILINQYRSNISTMSRKAFKPFGAEAVKYVSKLTLETRRVEKDADKGRANVEIFVEKTKLGGVEGIKTSYWLQFGQGPDYAEHLLTLAKEYDIIETSGVWFYYGDLKAHGEDKAKALFPMKEIEQKILEKL